VKDGWGIAECQWISRKVGKSMSVSQEVDQGCGKGNAVEKYNRGWKSRRRFGKVEDGKMKLGWVEEWIVAEDRWRKHGSSYQLFIAWFFDHGS
jgi:hypothetical protein